MTGGVDQLVGVAFAGAMVPIALGFVYWAAVDSMKRYTNRQVREAKQELRAERRRERD